MEKIIWWWNVVYYFTIKWYMEFGNAIFHPLMSLYKSKIFENHWKKMGITNLDKSTEEWMRPVGKTFTRFFLCVLLFSPIFAIVIIIDSLLKKYNLYDGEIFGFCGIAIGAFMAVVPLQNYLLGKDDRYKKYFKEFDKMFKTNKRKQHLYGLLSFITVIVLFSTIIFGFLIADKIRLG